MQYDIQENSWKVLVFDPEIRRGSVCATPTGVYYSYIEFGDQDKEFVVAFYEFATTKSRIAFRTKYHITNILYADAEKIYLVYNNDPGYGFGFSLKPITTYCAKVMFKEIRDNRIVHIENPFDIFTCTGRGSLQDYSAYAYPDRLLYSAESGSLKAVNYQTGEITELAHSAMNRSRYERGNRIPTAFYRLGNWVYYEEENSSNKDVQLKWKDSFCKVSLSKPDSVKIIQTYETTIGSYKTSERQMLEDALRVEHLKH